MEYLPHGFRLEIPTGCFPLTTDSMVLSHIAGAGCQGKVLDLGSGCGQLGLLLCAENDRCRVTGIELDPAAHGCALENIRRNGLTERMESICDDLRRVPGLFAPGSFDCCISNPPYFSGGPAARLTLARREEECTLADVLHAAAWAVKFGGDVFLVHRPERMGQVIALGAANKLETKELTLVRHREGGPIALVVFRLRKGAKPGLTIRELSLHHKDGTPTKEYREIYHIQEA